MHDYDVVKPVGIHKVIRLESRILVYEKGWDLEIPHPTERHQNLFTFIYECSFDFKNDTISQISEISMYNDNEKRLDIQNNIQLIWHIGSGCSFVVPAS